MSEESRGLRRPTKAILASAGLHAGTWLSGPDAESEGSGGCSAPWRLGGVVSSQSSVVGGADPTEDSGQWGRLPFPYLGRGSVGSWASRLEPIASRKVQNLLPESTGKIGFSPDVRV